ncbi:Protein CBG01205 [Caenorhabditis briggsae]|uniref:Protein CBG01205 n=1 Tax=Caenorhabditis briggsae TaxID=6238 RepID=A8WPU3_CAEBR|nr:Protein CBG01205 [Caenorhabditis briggsae]CAP22500.2 Protein CBG01205 [Caenorhabditis briggsae]
MSEALFFKLRNPRSQNSTDSSKRCCQRRVRSDFHRSRPKHFRVILNFMRDGHVDLQKYSEDVTEIQKEAEYYFKMLDEIVKIDVGGYVFKTFKSTLEKSDGFFKQMLKATSKAMFDESLSIRNFIKKTYKKQQSNVQESSRNYENLFFVERPTGTRTI